MLTQERAKEIVRFAKEEKQEKYLFMTREEIDIITSYQRSLPNASFHEALMNFVEGTAFEVG